jgi:hypothetical protein
MYELIDHHNESFRFYWNLVIYFDENMFNRLISCINYGKIFREIHDGATRSTKLLGRRRTSAINSETAAYTIICQ